MRKGEKRDAGVASLLPLAGEGVDAKRRWVRGNADFEVSLIRPGFAGPPSPASGRRAALLAIGVGFRKRCTGEALADLIGEALSELASKQPDLAHSSAVLATIAEKDRPTLRDAASLLGLDLVILPKTALLGTDDRITVASERVRACFGIPSVAEAAALVAAGPGSRLVVARIASADATCAIAMADVP